MAHNRLVLHTGNLKEKLSQQITRNPWLSAGAKNSELACALTHLTKQEGSFDPIRVNPETKPCEFCLDQNTKHNISLKLFLSADAKPSTISEAVETYRKQLCLKSLKIDILILSFAKTVVASCIVEYMKTYYQEAEKLVEAGIVRNIGIADVGAACFRSIYDQMTVKPSVAQINISENQCPVLAANCCFKELRELSKEKDILLLTHTDITPFLTKDSINELGYQQVQNVDAVLRYGIEAKSRAVLLAKGYFVFAISS